MKTTLAILICKFVTKVCKIFKKNGTVFPGERVLKLIKNPIDKIKYPKYVVIVTGSSGKGSSVSMIANILESRGQKVIWNKSGSNIKNAITTLVLNNSKAFSHKMDADILLLEMDERHIKETFKPGIITHLAITNVTRDQPARNIDPLFIYEKIMACVDKNVHLIINIDDPLINRAKYSHPSKITTYGIASTKYDSKKTPSYPVDFAYCPSCHAKLKYSSYHYGHLGIYECPNCSFRRGKADYEASEVDLNKGYFKIGETKLSLNKNVFFAVYYTLLAYTVCDVLGIKKEDILKEINENNKESKRLKKDTIQNRTIEMLESKNENAISYIQSLNYIKNQKGTKTVIMGFENVSRRYSYNDLSWLWDVEFELLNDPDIDKIFLIGRFKYDVAVRLDYASIDQEKIVFVEDLSKLFDMVCNMSKGNIYTMVCFDMTEVINKMLKELKHEKEDD